MTNRTQFFCGDKVNVKVTNKSYWEPAIVTSSNNGNETCIVLLQKTGKKIEISIQRIKMR